MVIKSTVSILFSDYLLSNNHVNSIIEHKFDFSDEEVMAYYISFLKTLSLKLNGQTIHFFYNEVSVLSLVGMDTKQWCISIALIAAHT